jgi:hypothetical protein
MSAPSLSSAVREGQDYLTAVERELADLPGDDRSALLEDLALHLDSLAAEDDDRPIAVRLGPAAAYAADLRAAAGLPARPGGIASAPAGLRDRLARISAGRAVREVRRLFGELRPAWWVLRGYLVVLAPCLVKRDGISDVPVPAPLDSHVLGVALVVAAVVASVALGRRTLGRPVRVLVGVGGAALVLGSFVAAEGAWSALTTPAAYVAGPGPDLPGETYPLYSRYGPVTDLFPYAADGTPLEGVLLYDQDGRPLKVGFQEWWEDGCARVVDQPRAADGVVVPNLYPQAYELRDQGLDAFGNPMTSDLCAVDLPRPGVPLPLFPAQSAAPDPGD